MAYRICCLCQTHYTDEEGGPHPYSKCIEQLDEEIDHLVWRLETLTGRRRRARKLAKSERNKQQ